MPTTEFADKRGRTIQIDFDEDKLACVARHNGVLLGTFRFNEADPDTDSALLLLTHSILKKWMGTSDVASANR